MLPSHMIWSGNLTYTKRRYLVLHPYSHASILQQDIIKLPIGPVLE